MNEIDWNGVIFGMGVLLLGTVVLVVVLTQAGSFSRARIARRDEEAYRELSARYESLVGRVAARQDEAAEDLHAIRGQISEIAELLRQVG